MLKFRSPKRPPQLISWSELQADSEKLQEHLGTRNYSVGWLLFTLQRFGSLSLNVQYTVIYSLEPMVLIGVTAIFAEVIKSYVNMGIAAGLLLLLIVGVPYLWTWCQQRAVTAAMRNSASVVVPQLDNEEEAARMQRSKEGQGISLSEPPVGDDGAVSVADKDGSLLEIDLDNEILLDESEELIAAIIQAGWEPNDHESHVDSGNSSLQFTVSSQLGGGVGAGVVSDWSDHSDDSSL